jgi:hypothetical protein
MRRFELVAGLGGVVLAVSLWLTWYEFVPPPVDQPPPDGEILGFLTTYTGDFTTTAWQSFAVIDVLLAIVALLAIAVPIVSVGAKGPGKPIGLEVIASVTGLIGVLLVALRLVDAPGDDLELRLGAWIAFAGALVAWIGSWLSLRDESTPGAVAPDVPLRPVPS